MKDQPEEPGVRLAIPACNPATSKLSQWVTVAGYGDLQWRETQFTRANHEGLFVPWEIRTEFWLPPSKTEFSWGPYVRFAGAESNRPEVFENFQQYGIGFQVYPFSAGNIHDEVPSTWKSLAGPLRIFAEVNWQHFDGSENEWRPDTVTRAGLEYYKALHVNEPTHRTWAEIYGQLLWQSANDFDDHYDTWVLGNAVRTGVRLADSGPLSNVSPYAVVESSLTRNSAYWWENRLLVGAGIRIDPDLRFLPQSFDWLSRFVVFAEYVHVGAYYADDAPGTTPDDDLRIGLSIAIGDFFR